MPISEYSRSLVNVTYNGKFKKTVKRYLENHVKGVLNTNSNVYTWVPTYHYAISSTLWASYNLTEFWHCLPRDSIRSHRLKAQSHKTTHHPCTCQSQAQVVTCISDSLVTSHKFLQPLPWVELTCKSGSQNSRKHFTYKSMGLLLKSIIQEQPDGRDTWSKAWGKGSELPWTLQECYHPQITTYSPNQKLSEPPVFMEDSLCRHD